MSRKEIIDNCLTFLVAGHDTTTASLCHLIYCLVLYPEIQSKLFQEVNQSLEKETPLNEIVDRMPYLNGCLKESLRLMPVGLRIERKAIQNSFLGNIYVPKNCLVDIPIWFVHRDPDNFENPNDYKPERFLDGTKIKAGTYIPFAVGPRNCLGQRFAELLMKMTIAKLVQKFSIISCERTHVRL